VLTGFGRTGRWFEMEYFGVQADIMTIAKGMASCAPAMGGVVVSDRVNQPFLEGAELLHGFNYQGHADRMGSNCPRPTQAALCRRRKICGPRLTSRAPFA